MQHRKINILFVSVITVASLFLFLSNDNIRKQFDSSFDNSFCDDYGCNTEDITNMYADYVEGWKKEISNSFDEAEKKVFAVDDEVLGPHPDKDKCICKGSGVIVHGDGHKTPCPYHGRKMQKLLDETNLIYTPLLILE
tara:strand:- start:68 stop:481 length:414 start_codon:yes stop_codon:yes gene_type:complete